MASWAKAMGLARSQGAEDFHESLLSRAALWFSSVAEDL